MASAAGAANRVLRVTGPILLPAVAYGAYKGNVLAMLQSFFTGPGRTSRVVALVVVLVNWKSLPFAWTVCNPWASRPTFEKKAFTKRNAHSSAFSAP